MSESAHERVPRYLPDRPFPRYAFVPGLFPHPTRDPAGHHDGIGEDHVPPVNPDDWRSSHAYLHGIDLFNHGYYWEAHEAWESLWIANGRVGCVAVFVKGLIALAAAGVKIREGRSAGARRHAERAHACFYSVYMELSAVEARFMGLSLHEMIDWASGVEISASELDGHPEERIAVVFPFVLYPV